MWNSSPLLGDLLRPFHKGKLADMPRAAKFIVLLKLYPAEERRSAGVLEDCCGSPLDHKDVNIRRRTSSHLGLVCIARRKICTPHLVVYDHNDALTL